MNEPDQTQELIVSNLADSAMSTLTITGPKWIRSRVIELLSSEFSHAAILHTRTLPNPLPGAPDEPERRSN